MNILVTLDRNYLPPLRVMLGSLLRNDPGETFEIYAIGDGLLPEDWAALEELCAGRGAPPVGGAGGPLRPTLPVARYWTRAMYSTGCWRRSCCRVLWTGCCIWTRTFW